MRLISLPQYKRNVIRFTEIVRVLSKYGLGGWLKATDPEFLKKLFKSKDGETVAGANGPTYTAGTAGTHDYNCRVQSTQCGDAIFDGRDTTITSVDTPTSDGIVSAFDVVTYLAENI